MRKGSLSYLPPGLKLVTLIILSITGALITTTLAGIVATPLFGVDFYSIESIYGNMAFMRALQIVQSIMVFILPSAVAVHFLYTNAAHVIPGRGQFTNWYIVIAIVIVIFSQPFISWSGWLNLQLELPESWLAINDWIISKENEAKEITTLMLSPGNNMDLAITIFMIAVLPAIGEEWFFRGIFQRELIKVFKNRHIGILATAIVFSAIHVQFLTFLPRFVLGIMLGYLMVYSQNIWLPVIAHFCNNLLAVLFYQHTLDKGISTNELNLDYTFDLWTGLSLASLVALLFLTRQIGKRINYDYG